LSARQGAAALVLAVALAGAWPLAAQPPGPAGSEALAAAVRTLLDPALRSAVLAGNPPGGALGRQVRALTGGSDALTQEFFALAADVLQELTQATGGDPAALAQTLDGARSDPGTFAAMLSPRTQERLRRLSVAISDQRR
jgi:hypothetical protein